MLFLVTMVIATTSKHQSNYVRNQGEVQDLYILKGEMHLYERVIESVCHLVYILSFIYCHLV